MIPDHHTTHRASYDDEGNIILPGMAGAAQNTAYEPRKQEELPMEEGVWHAPVAREASIASFAWEATDEPEAEAAEHIVNEAPGVVSESPSINSTVSDVWDNVRECVYVASSGYAREGLRQIESTAEEGKALGRETMGTLRRGSLSTWRFLTQPVWIPGRNNQPRQYSRGTLFILDTVRFGGTFAALFTLLFAGMNYQSFFTIAESYIDPLAEVTGMKEPSEDKRLAEKLKSIPMLAVAGTGEGAIGDFLPPVGPPDNRIIIPKLDLNVPIVTPANEALLREDWKRLEDDIQYALQDGVVHYPGTARPGQPGNFFVTGHSSYFPWAPGDFKSVFARLHELSVGDEYWVFFGGDRHRYIVKEKKEIKPSDVTVLDQPVNKRVSTLMTCTPVGTTLRRLIIVAQEVDPVTGIALDVGDRASEIAAPKVKMDMLPI